MSNPKESGRLLTENMSVSTDSAEENLFAERPTPTRFSIQGDDKYRGPRIYNLGRLPFNYKAALLLILIGLMMLISYPIGRFIRNDYESSLRKQGISSEMRKD